MLGVCLFVSAFEISRLCLFIRAMRLFWIDILCLTATVSAKQAWYADATLTNPNADSFHEEDLSVVVERGYIRARKPHVEISATNESVSGIRA